MTLHLAFIHGWGFPHTVWHPLAALLPGSHNFIDPLTNATPDHPSIVIAHSMGVLWFLKERPFPARALIALNGFRRFSEGDGWPGVPRRLLDRMRAQFARMPESVWSDFQARCGLPATMRFPPGDVADMARGLEYLADADARKAATDFPLLALAGRRDAIVPEALAIASFGEAVRWLEEGTHMLPLQHPDWCAARIMPFLQEVP